MKETNNMIKFKQLKNSLFNKLNQKRLGYLVNAFKMQVKGRHNIEIRSFGERQMSKICKKCFQSIYQHFFQ